VAHTRTIDEGGTTGFGSTEMIYIGIGANPGRASANVDDAVALAATAACCVLTPSTKYRTAPIDSSGRRLR
jgi:7,8-dihydro-6-hydroxymethylpterin-pyrophosphokinase